MVHLRCIVAAELCNMTNRNNIKVKVKVKQSRNSPGVAQRVPGGLGSQISWHLAHEGGEVVSLTHWPPLPPGMLLVLIFTRGRVDPKATVWSDGNMSLKNPVAPTGIDPGIVRLVAQHLNHYTIPGPNRNNMQTVFGNRQCYTRSVRRLTVVVCKARVKFWTLL
jgi:hypothetical protein